MVTISYTKLFLSVDWFKKNGDVNVVLTYSLPNWELYISDAIHVH